MKTDIQCYLEDSHPKPIPDSMDTWLDPDRTAAVCTSALKGQSTSTSSSRRSPVLRVSSCSEFPYSDNRWQAE